MLLSAGHAMSCCVLVGPCCLVLAVLCAAVHLFAPVASCWLHYMLLCACRPMLLSAGCAMCLLAHAASACHVVCCCVLTGPVLLSTGLTMCCYVLVGLCCLMPVMLHVDPVVLHHRVTLDPYQRVGRLSM